MHFPRLGGFGSLGWIAIAAGLVVLAGLTLAVSPATFGIGVAIAAAVVVLLRAGHRSTLSFLSAGAVALAVYSIGLGVGPYIVHFLAPTLLFILLAVVLWLKRGDANITLVSPFTLACASFMVPFGWAGLEILRDSGIPLPLAAKALWYVILGFALFTVGYSASIGSVLVRRLHPPQADFSSQRAVSVIALCWLGGIGVFSVLLRFSEIGGIREAFLDPFEFRLETMGSLAYGQLLFTFLLQSACMLYFLRVLLKPRPRVVQVVLFGCILLTTCLVFWVFGSRLMFLNLFGGMGIAFHYLRRRLRPREILAGLILTALFVPTQGVYRGQASQFRTVDDFVFALQKTDIRDAWLERLDAFSNFTQVLQLKPRYDPVKIVEGIILRPLPRAIVPDKPLADPGEITKVLWPEAASTGITLDPSMFGALHFDFGVIGVILGMLAYGVIVRMLQSYLENNAKRPSFLFHYSLIFMVAPGLLLGGFDSFYMVALIAFTTMAWVLLWALGPPPKHPSGLGKLRVRQ